MEQLCKHDWPGNVRELQNTVERVMAVNRQNCISADLVARMMQDDDSVESSTYPLSTTLLFDNAEEIRQALQKTKGRQAAAAKLLGISRSTLWRRIKSLGLRF